MQASIHTGYWGVRRQTGVFALVSIIFTLSVAQAAPAPDGNSVLILADTIGTASPSLEESKAATQGFTVVVVDAAAWGAMTTAEFASYQAIILGDKSCDFGSDDAAEANRAVWSPAITGNIVAIGTDPTYHSSFYAGGLPGADGDQVADSGIAFAAAEDTTGAYICLSCYYHGTAPGTPVPVLDGFGSFTVTGVGCYNDSHIVAVHPALSGLTNTSLSDWSCSVHEAFDGFPSDFLPLAIAEGIGGAGSLSFADGTFGIPYIIARGEELSPIFCGNGILEATEECDDGNTANGDGCSAQCAIEGSTASVCGNGIVEDGEECDPPTAASCASLDYCNENCLLAERPIVCGDGCVDTGETCDDGNTVDGDGCAGDCSNQPPDCSAALASVSSLWPPNHQMAGVAVLGITDPDSDPIAVVIDSIWQDEPTDTFGDGQFCPDADGVGSDLALVRSERSGTKKVPGDGRVYKIVFTASDGNDNCSGSVEVCVPHDMGQGSFCINSGTTYNSTSCP